jgi:hypothetical protein
LRLNTYYKSISWLRKLFITANASRGLYDPVPFLEKINFYTGYGFIQAVLLVVEAVRFQNMDYSKICIKGLPTFLELIP